jgi:hypothetical protein
MLPDRLQITSLESPNYTHYDLRYEVGETCISSPESWQLPVKKKMLALDQDYVRKKFTITNNLTFRIIVEQDSNGTTSRILMTNQVKWQPSMSLSPSLDSVWITIVQSLQQGPIGSMQRRNMKGELHLFCISNGRGLGVRIQYRRGDCGGTMTETG